MKNEAKYRIKYYVSVLYPVFSENFRKNDYLCREVFQEKLRLLEVENVFGGRAKTFPYPYFGLIAAPKKATDK
ncbi:MAG: hypothetical protein NC209_03425 [Alistipes sp.]|nr:hypothetical protein [Alistipes senegalensis]MCM1250182.1 hypothetical protein [Alistipes sp.]